jgi:hypothetical protein
MPAIMAPRFPSRTAPRGIRQGIAMHLRATFLLSKLVLPEMFGRFRRHP